MKTLTHSTPSARALRALRRSVRDAIMEAIGRVDDPSAADGEWSDDNRGDFSGPWVDDVVREEIAETLRHLRPFMRRKSK